MRDPEQTLAQTGPGSSQQPLGEPKDKVLLLHPRFLIPAQFYLHQPAGQTQEQKDRKTPEEREEGTKGPEGIWAEESSSFLVGGESEHLWEYLFSEPNPHPVQFLTHPGTCGLCSHIRNHSLHGASTRESDTASCVARPLRMLC